MLGQRGFALDPLGFLDTMHHVGKGNANACVGGHTRLKPPTRTHSRSGGIYALQSVGKLVV